ncbi:transcription factor DUO1-like [Cornus florida]|uniref:transcription factor DUO1-like n=1 Tax=Cornus florida TaxID=4283 RepID=UPI00289CB743|nr:transcription factor DUO1-like [Cornus florida]
MYRYMYIMERGRDEQVIKKGPWTAEEDEVLINFVKKNGPRDWSSIRSNGLLPRTGKSCRLRWVNKLRPNLKIGCKFSAEEERVVIDLQGKFGNKWAAIASYLPGRTDNDVKNFWSTRQKRLARILKSHSQQSKSQRNKGKAIAVDEMPTLQVIVPNYATPMKEDSSSHCQSCSSSNMGNPEPIKMVPLPDLFNPNLPNITTTLPILDITDTDHNKPSIETTLQFPFTQLPQPRLDLPLLPEGQHDFVEGLCEPNNFLLDVFMQRELEIVAQPGFVSPLVDLDGDVEKEEGRGENDKLATPDSFFDDFPADMFDYIEPIPSSSAL